MRWIKTQRILVVGGKLCCVEPQFVVPTTKYSNKKYWMCVIVEMRREVEVQLLSDLHAADARYHDDCRTTFMAPRSVQAAAECLGLSDTKVVKVMRSDTTHIWTSTEVFKLYKESGGVFLSRCALVQKLSELFDKELIILSAGLANIIAFRDRCDVLQVVEDEEDDVSIVRVAKQILKES